MNINTNKITFKLTKEEWMNFEKNGNKMFPNKEKAEEAWTNVVGFGAVSTNVYLGNEAVKFLNKLENEYNLV